MANRIYYESVVKNIHCSVTVRTQVGFMRRGAFFIPHKIAEAVYMSVTMIDHALSQMTAKNYADPNHDIARIHFMVYRDDALRKACHIAHDKKKDPKEAENARETINLAFAPGTKASRDTPASKGGAITQLIGDLKKIKLGLTTPPLVIKVNQKLRPHHQTQTQSDEVVPKYYRGLVQNMGKAKHKTDSDKDGIGHIEIGYESFRTQLYIPRIIVHEAAHKYAKAGDGRNGNGGYWKSNFSDYLDPGGTTLTNNADSHALFVWALSQSIVQQKIGGQFNESMARRWN